MLLLLLPLLLLPLPPLAVLLPLLTPPPLHERTTGSSGCYRAACYLAPECAHRVLARPLHSPHPALFHSPALPSPPLPPSLPACGAQQDWAAFCDVCVKTIERLDSGDLSEAEAEGVMRPYVMYQARCA